MTDSKKNLQINTEVLATSLEEINTKINIKKTKMMMIISTQQKIHNDGLRDTEIQEV